MNTENHNLTEQKPLWEPVPGRETGTVTKELLEAQCGQLRVQNARGTPSLAEGPHFCEFYLLDLCQLLTVNIGEKSPHVSSKGREK